MISRFPIGMLLLVVVSILIYFGLAHRILDRMRLSDRTALGILVLMAIGSFIDIPLGGQASINLGGGLVPIGLAIYIIARAGTTWEWVRALLSAGLTAGAVYGVERLMSPEPENLIIDPIYVYPLVAGVVAYLIGRSRRTAFVAATLGIVLLDLGQYLWMVRTGMVERISIGGAGVFDAIVIAGIIAVLLAEIVGETRERLQGGPEEEGRSRGLLKGLRNEGLKRFLYPAPQRKPEANGRSKDASIAEHKEDDDRER
ncbi:MAG: DUF1614 domain-containing protein [Syntrophomonadaceae bacterium]|nr:DUF1614 domain-containing protein [Syntrophomonadaceae bacterium]